MSSTVPGTRCHGPRMWVSSFLKLSHRLHLIFPICSSSLPVHPTPFPQIFNLSLPTGFSLCLNIFICTPLQPPYISSSFHIHASQIKVPKSAFLHPTETSLTKITSGLIATYSNCFRSRSVCPAAPNTADYAVSLQILFSSLI